MLWDEESGEWFIWVLCGGMAIYNVSVRLTSEEVERFQNDPTSLDYLAYNIRYREDDFKDRRIELRFRDGIWSRATKLR